jgi:hypothetical protein
MASNDASLTYRDVRTVRIARRSECIHVRDVRISLTWPPYTESLVESILDAFAPAASTGQGVQTQDHRIAHFSARYKLVFSLLNEDVSQAGVHEWDAAKALQRKPHDFLTRL